MNKNKFVYYSLLIIALIVTYASIGWAQARAFTGQAPSLIEHGLLFLLAIALVVAAVYARPK